MRRLGADREHHRPVRRSQLAQERLRSLAGDLFEGVDLERLRGMQRAFLTMALGGAKAYEGRDLRAAHAPLVARGLSDVHFDRFMKALRETLQEMGVGDEAMIDVLTVLEGTRSNVLGLGAPAGASPARHPPG